MASEYPFEIKEHKVEAQHIREYPNATAHSQEEVLYLSVKQYIPKNNPSPNPGDVTIIASHANGFVKVSSPRQLSTNCFPSHLLPSSRNSTSRYGRTSSSL
jgi:hypothetical protein